jgi:hypothetical protein
MKKIVLLFIIHYLLLIVVCNSQPSITWQRTYDGPMHNDDWGMDVCNADNGNFYIVGSTPIAGSGYCVYVLKINPYGDTVWTRIPRTHATGNAIVSINDGGCVLTGGSNLFTIKLDADGNVIWQKTYGGSSLDCWDIIRTTDGGYIACGEQVNVNRDGIIFKVDSLGNLQWQKNYPSPFEKSFKSIEQTNDGGYIAVGYVQDYLVDTGRALITKIDSVGNVAWEKQYKMIRGGEANSIKKVNGGYIVQGITGYTFNPYLTAYPYFIRVNSLGDTTFVKTFPDDTLTFIARFNVINPNKYIIGCTFDSIVAQTHDGKFIVTDSLGNVIYKKNFHSLDYMDIYSILPLPNGDILSVGLIDNGTNTFEDIYAMRTDSILNSPPIGIKTLSRSVPVETHLFPNLPNPFNSVTYLYFQVSKGGNILIKIYDITGKEVAVLFDGFIKQGVYKLKWDASNFSSGIYFGVLIEGNNNLIAQKLILLK